MAAFFTTIRSAPCRHLSHNRITSTSAPLYVATRAFSDSLSSDEKKRIRRIIQIRRVVAAGVAPPSKAQHELSDTEMSDYLRFAGNVLGEGVKFETLPLPDEVNNRASTSMLKYNARLAERLGIPLPYHPKQASWGEASKYNILWRNLLREKDPEPVYGDWGGEREDKATAKQRVVAEKLKLKWHQGITRGELGDLILAKQKERWLQRQTGKETARAGAGKEAEAPTAGDDGDDVGAVEREEAKS